MRRFSVLLALACWAVGDNVVSAADDRGTIGRWKALLETVCDGDTMTVHGLWRGSLGEWGDSTFSRYRIESSRGDVIDVGIDWVSPVGGWCDDLRCSIDRWDAGWVASVSASCSPSFPHAAIQTHFVYMEGSQVVAVSDWTGIEWSPSNGDSTSRPGCGHCVDFAIPMRVVRDGKALRFVDAAPSDVNPDSTFRVDASLDCHMWPEDAEPATIAFRVDRESAEQESLTVVPGELRVISAMVRLEPLDGVRWPEVVDIQILASGRSGWILPGVLEALGLASPP